jgi:hypothetical protein
MFKIKDYPTFSWNFLFEKFFIFKWKRSFLFVRKRSLFKPLPKSWKNVLQNVSIEIKEFISNVTRLFVVIWSLIIKYDENCHKLWNSSFFTKLSLYFLFKVILRNYWIYILVVPNVKQLFSKIHYNSS